MDEHDQSLNDIINYPHKIGEQLDQISWVMKEGIWLREETNDQRKFCDIIFGYWDKTGVPIEYKNSPSRREHALKQLRNGILFLEEELGVSARYGLFVWSDQGTYEYERYTTKDLMGK